MNSNSCLSYRKLFLTVGCEYQSCYWKSCHKSSSFNHCPYFQYLRSQRKTNHSRTMRIFVAQAIFSLSWGMQTIKSFFRPWGLGGKLCPGGRSIQIDSDRASPRECYTAPSAVLRSISRYGFIIYLPSLISLCFEWYGCWLWGHMRSAKFQLKWLKSVKMRSLAGYLSWKQVGKVRICLAAAMSWGRLQEKHTITHQLYVKQTDWKAPQTHISSDTHISSPCLSTVHGSKVVSSIIRPS